MGNKNNPLSREASEGFSFIRTFVNSGSAIGECPCIGFSTCPPPNLLKGVGFFAGVPARGVAEQGISAVMRARRSRSQHAQRWERGRLARHANRARKNLPL
jgi:hypothetical protein